MPLDKSCFKRAYKIFKVLAAQMHFRRAQMNITLPITRCQHTHYAPKVARVIKTRGQGRALAEIVSLIVFCLSCSDLRENRGSQYVPTC